MRTLLLRKADSDKKGNQQCHMFIYSQLGVKSEKERKLKFSRLLLSFSEIRRRLWCALIWPWAGLGCPGTFPQRSVGGWVSVLLSPAFPCRGRQEASSPLSRGLEPRKEDRIHMLELWGVKRERTYTRAALERCQRRSFELTCSTENQGAGNHPSGNCAYS